MEIRMLGGVEVVGALGALALGPTARTLLAVLLVRRRRVVPLDVLGDALWGDVLPATARPTLQTHLSKLRRDLAAVEGASLLHRPPGYVVDAPRPAIDADRFEDLVVLGCSLAPADPDAAIDAFDRALGAWEGPALAEFADTEWARPEAARLDELRLVAVEERVEVRLQRGEHDTLVPELEATAREHPLRERTRSQLMVALHRSGRQAEALRAAHDLRRLLGEQLGLEPSPQLQALEREIAVGGAQATPSAAPPTRGGHRPAPTAARPRGLPVAATTLVGRDRELDELVRALGEARLVTLVGPGGVGKSRLAFALADLTEERFDDGVRLVELAAVADPGAAIAAVAAALAVERRPDRSLEESVVELLGPLDLLLVMDNCEHVHEPAARFVAQVLRWCPRVRVLATSRQPVAMAGEVVWRVEPLAVPSDLDAAPSLLSESPSVAVFVGRAADAAPGFTLSERNARAVAEVCVELDGVPLALELAAARMGSMSVEQLRDRLHERFALLEQGPAVDERHRTLGHVVEWSYELLAPGARLLLDRLSVFAGGFDLAEAEETCSDEILETASVLPLLTALVDQSLVVADTGVDVPRYRQLETIRQYGAGRLEMRADATAVRCAHLRTFAALAERAEEELDGPAEGEWSVRLDREFDNLREAVRTASATGDADTGLRLVVAARELSFRRMRYELVRWAEELTELPGAQDHPLLPTALAMVAYGSFVRGDLRTAVDRAERSLGAGLRLDRPSAGLAERALANALVYQGDREAGIRWATRLEEVAQRSGRAAQLAHARYMRSVATTSFGDPAEGARLAERARRSADEAGSPTARSQAGYAHGLALAALGEPGATLDAIAVLDDATRLATDVGNRWMRAFALTEAMWLRARIGDTAEALSGYREVVETWYQSGDWANQWLSLRQLAGILASVGEDEEAALLFGAVAAAGAQAALPFAPADADDLAQLGRQLEDRLGADAVAGHRRRGEKLRDEAVVATALAAIDDIL